MMGAAKLLPVAVIDECPFHATSTSIPAAAHSAGARGLHQIRSRSMPGPHATENTPAYSLGIVRFRSLLMADTNIIRRNAAASTMRWNVSAHFSFVVERLKLAIVTPLSTHQSRPRAKTPAEPFNDAPSTR